MIDIQGLFVEQMKEKKKRGWGKVNTYLGERKRKKRENENA